MAIVYPGPTLTAAPSGSASGDLSGTYPSPTVAKVAGTTPGAGGLAVLDDASTASVRTTLSVPRMYSTTTAPTVNSDSSAGFAVGDLWNNTTGGATYVADSVSVGAASWRVLLIPTAGTIVVENDQVVAYGGVVSASGGFTRIGAAYPCTAEDDSYGEVISGDVITIAGAGLATGDSGAIQSNSRRYSVPLSALGITLSGSSPKLASIRLLCDSITDNGEARAGTIAALAWLGVGSTTALDITGIQRPATGTGTYQEVRARTSASVLTTGTASNLNFGSALAHEFPGDDATLFYGGLTSTGAIRASGVSSGGAISASNPTHLVLAFRASPGASGIVFNDLRVTFTFGPAIADI